MKHIDSLRRGAVGAMAAVAMLVPAAVEAGQITVHIQGVRSDDGIVRIGVFSDESSFPQGHRIAGQSVQARRGDVVATFDDLAPGVYAIAIHHDEDGDGEFDTTFIGLPDEGYGFSNDAPVVFGPPKFDEAAIAVVPDGVTTELRVRY